MTEQPRVPLEWVKSGAFSATFHGKLAGVPMVSYYWHSSGDRPWRLDTKSLPSSKVLTDPTAATEEQARAILERFVARWLTRTLDAAREAGWTP